MKVLYKHLFLRITILMNMLLLLAPSSGFALDNGLARTPIMGWSSWNCFNVNVYEFQMIDIANVMISSGMRELGYEYVISDGGWEADPFFPRDGNGEIIAHPEKFPNGMKHIGDYIHSRGMKLGIYINFRAGVSNIQKDANTLAFWGADRVKVDFFGGSNDSVEYSLWRDAIANCGRPMIFHICRWQFPGTWVTDVGHSWRTSGDLMDTWASCISNLDKNRQYAYYAGPGQWNDPDMMMVGVGMMTLEEYRTQFSMWCMMAAPLRAGNDLRSMTPEIKNILMAPEIIAINQDSLGIQGDIAKDYGDQEVWVKPLVGGMKAVALFNRGPNTANITVNWTDIGLPSGNARVRDLWKRQDVGTFTNSYSMDISSHGTEVLRIIEGASGTNTAPDPPCSLRCENQINPTQALTLIPWLKWRFRDRDIGDLQSAYQIIVADNQTDITNNTGNIWNSNKTNSLDTYMKYAGPALTGGKSYYWKVKVWDQNDLACNFSNQANFVLVATTNNPPQSPGNLQCNGQTDPVDITGYPPTFSWTFNDTDKGAYQSAYHVIVSSSKSAVQNNRGTLWDTEKVYSVKNNVVYGGQGLHKGVTYYWNVMTWDDNCEAGPFSAAGSFSMQDAPGADVLCDPGFESNGYGWECINATERQIDTTVSHSGKNSEKMWRTGQWPREVYQDAMITGGHKFRASTWIKTDGVTGNDPNLMIIWLDTLLNGYWDIPPSAILRRDTVGSLTGTNNWTELAGQYTAPVNAKSARFYLFLNSGTAWFDDNELYDLDAAEIDQSNGVSNIERNSLTIQKNTSKRKIVVKYTLVRKSFVEIAVYNLQGKLIKLLFSGTRSAGSFSCGWESGGSSSGVYLVKMKAGKENIATKVFLTQ